jgi:predicted Zn-dependent protease
MKDSTMKRWIYVLVSFTIFVSAIHAGNEYPRDSVILRAMRDELKNNMENLVYADYEKSFFISYTLASIEEIYATSSLGALVYSERDTSKSWTARVMVGNYEINDENYDDYNNIETNEVGIAPLPVENDYYGIRRTFWAVTNNIYKKAALSYKNKISALEQRGLSDTILQIPDFSETPVQKVYEAPITIEQELSQFENLTRALSAAFKSHPEIISSNVTLDAFNARIYFINSEGTESVTTETIFSLVTSAEVIGNYGEPLNNKVNYHVSTFDELPTKEKLLEGIQLLVDNLKALKNAPTLEENYYGPVLFMDQAVAKVLEKSLFSGSNKLVAEREPLVNSPQMKLFYGNPNNSLEDKIDRRIANNDLTIKAYPRMGEFNGVKLLGSFPIDAEGVVPPEELVLVENGILKTLLNDRTPTRKLKISNGHKRFAINYSTVNKETGPGVISVSSSNEMSVEALKAMLIKKVKNEGLDYGILIRPVFKGQANHSLNIYRVYVEDGREELVSSAYLRKLPSNPLRRIMGSSSEKIIVNDFSSSGSMGEKSLARGMMVSYVVPTALLFEESEVINVRKPVASMDPITKSPLHLLME